MPFNVDIDEADVAVLNQNLIKSKELFTSISKSLTKVSSKSINALRNIKPILNDVNKLNSNKRQVENGIRLLSEVNESAAIIHKFEDLLNNRIELIGLRKFIETLNKSRNLLREIKPKFKQFQGIILNFENLIDRSEAKLETYFLGLIGSLPQEITSNEVKLTDLQAILKYYNNESGNINKTYILSRSKILVERVKPFAAATKPVERASNHPYEKGTNGINRFNNECIKGVREEQDLLVKLGMSPIGLMNPLIERCVGDIYNHEVLHGFNTFFNSTRQIVNNDLLLLEIIENLAHFQVFCTNYDIVHKEFKTNVDIFILKNSVLLKEYLLAIEARFHSVSVFNDKNIPEIIVELISKLRRSSEFQASLLKLIANFKLGDWLLIKPPVKFINVYTSVIPNNSNDESAEYLLSSFFSDIVDSIMINIEIGLKNNEVAVKKSTQGFYLIKNLIMIETIINRSSTLFEILGTLGTERLNKLKNRFLKLFLDDWNYASYIIIRDMTSIATSNAAHNGGVVSSLGGGATNLSSKERDSIKELFKNFNESFEEAIKNYEKYNITDANLRSYLSNEIKKLIINAYFKLYDKYGRSDFAKNKAKYVKYDKQSFEKLLNEKL